MAGSGPASVGPPDPVARSRRDTAKGRTAGSPPLAGSAVGGSEPIALDETSGWTGSAPESSASGASQVDTGAPSSWDGGGSDAFASVAACSAGGGAAVASVSCRRESVNGSSALALGDGVVSGSSPPSDPSLWRSPTRGAVASSPAGGGTVSAIRPSDPSGLWGESGVGGPGDPGVCERWTTVASGVAPVDGTGSVAERRATSASAGAPGPDAARCKGRPSPSRRPVEPPRPPAAGEDIGGREDRCATRSIESEDLAAGGCAPRGGEEIGDGAPIVGSDAVVGGAVVEEAPARGGTATESDSGRVGDNEAGGSADR